MRVPGWLGNALEGFCSSAGKRLGWQGRLLGFLCSGQREPWAAVHIPVGELFLQGILASAEKETPVLVSALVFLLKTSSVILHSAPPPAQGRAAVCVCD